MFQTLNPKHLRSLQRPGDDYKATHNVVVEKRDTLFGGQVCSSIYLSILSFCLEARCALPCPSICPSDCLGHQGVHSWRARGRGKAPVGVTGRV
jgi:hypothetical protein